MVTADDQGTPRVRPHVARAVGQTAHVLLDFDGILFDMQAALGRTAREKAVADLLTSREHRPRSLPITFGWYGVHETLNYLATNEPDHAIEAETLVSGLELDAALTARPARNMKRLFAACGATGRKVAVFSDVSEQAVLAALRAHQLDGYVDAIAARQGLDLAAAEAGPTIERAADLLGAAPDTCLAVSGSFQRLYAAKHAGAIGLGCVCGRNSRKHLAQSQTPVVSNLEKLSQALLLVPRTA